MSKFLKAAGSLGRTSKARLRGAVVLSLLVVGCAQVPKESVVLSATVGRDLAVVHAAHRELVRVLFERMRRDVHRFVDEVYAPFQIRTVMAAQREFATSGDPALRRQAMLPVFEAALKPSASAEARDTALAALQALIRKVRADVEEMRAELIAPLDAQESAAVDAIDVAYQRIAYANNVVTAHLASVVKVEEAQDEVLASAGVRGDVRGDVSMALADLSDHIGSVVDQATRAPNGIDQALDKAKALKASIGELAARMTTRRPPSAAEAQHGK